MEKTQRRVYGRWTNERFMTSDIHKTATRREETINMEIYASPNERDLKHETHNGAWYTSTEASKFDEHTRKHVLTAFQAKALEKWFMPPCHLHPRTLILAEVILRKISHAWWSLLSESLRGADSFDATRQFWLLLLIANDSRHRDSISRQKWVEN